jgi:UDP-N-acetylglucosamine transferase subunit ALG13
MPSHWQVVWQVGCTDVSDLGLHACREMSPPALQAEIVRADVVVAHAGVGSALTIMESGRCPVLVPRERGRGEHVDDHQLELARLLEDRGVAVHAPASSLALGHLESAARRRVLRPQTPEAENLEL